MSLYRSHPNAMEWGQQIRDLATVLDMFGEAMLEGDDITGPMCGGAVVDHLARLPQHIRDAFAENLTDDAARSARADDLYMQEVAA